MMKPKGSSSKMPARIIYFIMGGAFLVSILLIVSLVGPIQTMPSAEQCLRRRLPEKRIKNGFQKFFGLNHLFKIKKKIKDPNADSRPPDPAAAKPKYNSKYSINVPQYTKSAEGTGGFKNYLGLGFEGEWVPNGYLGDRCDACDGSGQITKKDETQPTDCTKCNGRGSTGKKCATCDGSGKEDGAPENDCPVCDGRGTAEPDYSTDTLEWKHDFYLGLTVWGTGLGGIIGFIALAAKDNPVAACGVLIPLFTVLSGLTLSLWKVAKDNNANVGLLRGNKDLGSNQIFALGFIPSFAGLWTSIDMVAGEGTLSVPTFGLFAFLAVFGTMYLGYCFAKQAGADSKYQIYLAIGGLAAGGMAASVIFNHMPEVVAPVLSQSERLSALVSGTPLSGEALRAKVSEIAAEFAPKKVVLGTDTVATDLNKEITKLLDQGLSDEALQKAVQDITESWVPEVTVAASTASTTTTSDVTSTASEAIKDVGVDGMIIGLAIFGGLFAIVVIAVLVDKGCC